MDVEIFSFTSTSSSKNVLRNQREIKFLKYKLNQYKRI